ncbi:pilus assembly protein [Rossellomorea vietnamensis]|uniref:TadE/TadG family type IV pilus assembly protein n=1 Tax=Rossellomorea vietnamensis TaxID=218284 RepID=UPI001CC95B19|nr:TadE family protein [Rossellomorea vietnamensis]MCA0150476.1 pilus assembly protein [Rossellomorea vietnamensis]
MRSEKGQSLVEFAFVLPLLLLLIFGIVDFGRYFHAALTVDHAGREAARAASVGNSDVVGVAVRNGSSIGLSAGQVQFSKSTEEATVRIVYPVTFITPVIGSLVGTLQVEDTTVMRIE